MGLLNIGRDINDIKRFDEILLILFEEGFGYVLENSGLLKRIPFHRRLARKVAIGVKDSSESNYARARRTLERLGPTFVKLGQMLSLRPDMVPEELCDELGKLQDSVRPMPFSKVKEVLEKELGRPLKSVFRNLEEKPVAAASIAQVHKAVLRNSKTVAVKVRRPGVDAVMREDIDIMRTIAWLLRHRGGFKSYNLSSIIDEFERYTRNELDFRREAKNYARFRENFRKFRDVWFPMPFTELCTEKVLVTEFVKGVEIRDILRLRKLQVNTRRIARIGTLAVLKQIFEDRFFHGDTHPGNLFVTGKRRIACVDVGIVGQLSEAQTEKLLMATFFVIQKETDKVIDSIIEIGRPMPDASIEKFREEASELLEQWYGTSLKEERITTVVYRMIILAGRNGITMPAEIVLFGKALVTMEGTAMLLDPEFNFFRETESYLRKLIAKKHSPLRKIAAVEKKLEAAYLEAEKIPERVIDLLKRLEQGKITIALDSQTAREIGMAASRSAARNIAKPLSIAAAGLLISSAILIASGRNEKIFNLSIAHAELYAGLAALLLLAFKLLKNSKEE